MSGLRAWVWRKVEIWLRLLLWSFSDLGGVSEFRRLLFYLCVGDSMFGWFASGWDCYVVISVG